MLQWIMTFCPLSHLPRNGDEILLKRNIDWLFLVFLAFSPLLDLASGIQAYLLNGGTGLLGTHQIVIQPSISISLSVRMAVLVIMALYLLIQRDKQAVLAGAGLVAAFALSVAGQALRGVSFSLREDILYMARYSFNIASIFTYAHVLRHMAQTPGLRRFPAPDGPTVALAHPMPDGVRRRIDDILCWTLLIASLGILLPYLADIGFYTYADPLGYRGCRGLFYSGNDAAALVMLLLPLLLCALMRLDGLKSRRGAAYLAAAACGVTAMLVLGTKTAFLAIGATFAGLAGYALFYAIWRHQSVLLARFGIFLLVFLVFFGILSLITHNKIGHAIYTSFAFTGEYAASQGLETAMLSGRTTKLIAVWHQFQAAMPLSLFTGLGRGSQQAIIEMDVLELIFYYGIPGTLLMAWVYLKNGILFLCDLFRRFTFTGWCCAISLALCCGYLFFAGHTLFSVTSGFYFALVLLYARTFSIQPIKEANP